MCQQPNQVPPSTRRRWCSLYSQAELPKCPWPAGRMAGTRGTRQAFAPTLLTESSVSTPSSQTFVFQLSPQSCVSVFPLHSFPIWPGQRLGLRDLDTLWLDAVVSDLDLGKRYGSGSLQTCCSTRDFYLASVPSPSSPIQIGLSGSPPGPHLEPSSRYLAKSFSPNRVWIRILDLVKATRLR